MDMEILTKAYIAMRDKRTELKKNFDAEYNKIGEGMERLQAEMLKMLMENKLDSARTSYGTVYRQVEVKPSCASWEALDHWIEATPEVNPSDVLEKRLSKKFITEYMENHDGTTPPGVSVFREFVVRVRRD